jgi:hypothetical protein
MRIFKSEKLSFFFRKEGIFASPDGETAQRKEKATLVFITAKSFNVLRIESGCRRHRTVALTVKVTKQPDEESDLLLQPIQK